MAYIVDADYIPACLLLGNMLVSLQLTVFWLVVVCTQSYLAVCAIRETVCC